MSFFTWFFYHHFCVLVVPPSPLAPRSPTARASHTYVTNKQSKIRPHEVYNLAAQSHVKVSFEMPQYTGEVDGMVRLGEIFQPVFLSLRASVPPKSLPFTERPIRRFLQPPQISGSPQHA